MLVAELLIHPALYLLIQVAKTAVAFVPVAVVTTDDRVSQGIDVYRKVRGRRIDF